LKKGIVYYTHGKCEDPAVLEVVRRQIDKCVNGYPVVNVSLAPTKWRENIVLNLEPSILTMFKQQLRGLKASTSDYIFFCEHDVLYHPSHFDFEPERGDTFYFNANCWALNSRTGEALFYRGNIMTSCCVAFRDLLIQHYEKKIAWVEEEGKFSRNRMGFEPGKKHSERDLGPTKSEWYWSSQPNVDIKHSENITRKRFKIEDYRCRRMIEDSWKVTDEIPYWGKTVPFKEFLRRADGR
jgi:hypothetical protein